MEQPLARVSCDEIYAAFVSFERRRRMSTAKNGIAGGNKEEEIWEENGTARVRSNDECLKRRMELLECCKSNRLGTCVHSRIE